MIVLIGGPNQSGKSVMAENILCRQPGNKIYVATMIPRNAENRSRIRKHRLRRKSYGFLTIEAPGSLDPIPVSSGDTVLLEDVSNFLANLLFEQKGTVSLALDQIKRLETHCRLLIAVTIFGLQPSGYHGETAGYIRALHQLNRQLSEHAAIVLEMEDGTPHLQKGRQEDALTIFADGAFHL